MPAPISSTSPVPLSPAAAPPGTATQLQPPKNPVEANTAKEPSAGALATLIVAVTCALTFSFLCSIFESVLLSVSRGHVEKMANSGSRAGRILRHWKKTDIEAPIAAILILNTLAHTVGATVAGSSYKAVSPDTLWLFSIVFTLAVLLFTEIIPKTLGVTFSERLAGIVTIAVSVLVFCLKPLLWLTGLVSKLMIGEHRKPVTSIEEIRLLASLGKTEGDVAERMADFIEGVASLSELTVHDVMVPRGEVAFLSAKRSLEENLEVIRESGHSRFPFSPTGNLDDVDRVVLAKELLFLAHDSSEKNLDWDALKQPLVVMPESKPLDRVLRMFQEQRKHLAVVVNEYGGTQGVLTLEDVLEEIVGEIEDETDQIEKLISQRSDGSLVCRGRAEMRKLLKVIGSKDKVEVVTLAGWVSEQLGRVPREGDEGSWKNLRFKVLKASRRRAERVEIRLVEKPSEEPADESSS